MAKKQYLICENCNDFTVYDYPSLDDDYHESGDEYEYNDFVSDDVLVEKVKKDEKKNQQPSKKWSGVVMKKPNVSSNFPSLLQLAYFSTSYDQRCNLPDSIHYLAVSK